MRQLIFLFFGTSWECIRHASGNLPVFFSLLIFTANLRSTMMLPFKLRKDDVAVFAEVAIPINNEECWFASNFG